MEVNIILDGSTNFKPNEDTKPIFFGNVYTRNGYPYASPWWVPKSGEDPEAELRANVQQRIKKAKIKNTGIEFTIERALQQADLSGVTAIIYFDPVPTDDGQQHFAVVSNHMARAEISAYDIIDFETGAGSSRHEYSGLKLEGVTAFYRGRNRFGITIHKEGEFLFVPIGGLIDRSDARFLDITPQTLEKCVEASRLS